MVRGFPLIAIAAIAIGTHAQERLSQDDLVRVDAAVRRAFAYLYALPSDTAAARMGSWVLDSATTTITPDRSGRWRILVTRLSDTGQGLKLNEMVGEAGTSPAQLAAAMAAMQRLEGKISKAEAEAAIDIAVMINPTEIVMPAISDDAQRTKPAIPGSRLSIRIHGDWMRLDDRELEVDYERWSPATLLVGFGTFGAVETARAQPKESLATFTVRPRPTDARRSIHTIAVTAQGNEEMLDRVIKETQWDALAALMRLPLY